MNSTYGIKIAKPGFSVYTADNKDLALTSQLDTFKVMHSGTITLNIPKVTWGDADTPASATYEESYTHNLGYVPYFTPVNGNKLLCAYNTTADYYMNDEVLTGPFESYSPPVDAGQYITLYATTTTLVLSVYRFYAGSLLGPPDPDVVFKARECTVDYTVFYNQMDAEFDLL
jgi:hypothetical protein